MPQEEQMCMDERFKYLRLMKKRYVQGSKSARGVLLDEMEEVTGLHRKSLIHLIWSDLNRRPRREQRGRAYGPEVDDALRVISESHDCICAERLQPTLVQMAIRLARHGELEVSPSLLDQLSRISVFTLRRIVRQLCGEISQLQDEIFLLPGAVPGQTEDV